jgi:hypothetical protein
VTFHNEGLVFEGEKTAKKKNDNGYGRSPSKENEEKQDARSF